MFYNFFHFRGERGIRTPEPLWTVTRFPGVPLQPLEHLSLRLANVLFASNPLFFIRRFTHNIHFSNKNT